MKSPSGPGRIVGQGDRVLESSFLGTKSWGSTQPKVSLVKGEARYHKLGALYLSRFSVEISNTHGKGHELVFHAVSRGTWLSVGSYGRSGQAETQEPASWADGGPSNAGVCVKQREDDQEGANFITPGSSAPRHLRTQLCAPTKERLPSPLQPAVPLPLEGVNQSRSVTRGGRQRPAFDPVGAILQSGQSKV